MMSARPAAGRTAVNNQVLDTTITASSERIHYTVNNTVLLSEHIVLAS